MSTTVKTVIVLIATLLVGVLLGALGSGAVANKREKERVELRSNRGMSSRIQSQIPTLTDEQRLQIQEIVRRHAPEMDSLRRQHQQEIGDSFVEMRSEIAAVLTPEQRANLERWMTGRRGFGPDRRTGPRDGPRRRRTPRP